MNLVMMAVDSLPRGGVIQVRIRNEVAGMTMTLTCKGDRARLKPEVQKAINSLSFSNFKIVDTEATKKQNGKSFVRTFDNDKNE